MHRHPGMYEPGLFQRKCVGYVMSGHCPRPEWLVVEGMG